MSEKNDIVTTGEDVARTIWGEGYGNLMRAVIDNYDPGLTDHIISFFGRAYSHPSLDVKTRQISTLCSLAALGLAPEMAMHFRGSLNLGWTQLEIREALLLTIFTAGIPKTINAFKVFHDVLGELKIDPEAEKRDNINTGDDDYKAGIEKGKKFFGNAWDEFLSEINDLNKDAGLCLIEDSMGRIFSRPELSDRVRAIIITASLTAICNTDMLKLFLPGAVNAGAKKEELKEIIFQIHGYSGWPAAISALKVFKTVFS